ncbi:MAG: 16S rRNA (cytidine(1402)-2'-O)-methyltransferase, partial [Trueperaceae bacterium]
VEVLMAADVVAAEDTRHSRTLLDRYGVTTKLERLDAHTMESRAAPLLERYEHVAYVTDAGTPGISDPGADLVRVALEMGVQVEVLPGATAFVPALVESGLPTARFTFEGFLPRKGAERRRRLAHVAASTATSIIYEAPNRLVGTLEDLADACGQERRASVSRELSKLHHETARGSLAELVARFAAGQVRGEIVIVVAPADEPPEDEGRPTEVATLLAGAGVRGRLLREALSALGVPRNEAYKLALEHPETDPDEP